MNIKCVFLSPLKVLFSHNLNIIHTYLANNDLKIIKFVKPKRTGSRGGSKNARPHNHTLVLKWIFPEVNFFKVNERRPQL